MGVYVYASFHWVSSSIEMNKRGIPPEIPGDYIVKVHIFTRKFLQNWYNMGTTYIHWVDFTTFLACKDCAVVKVLVSYQTMVTRNNYRFPFQSSSDWLPETKAIYFSELNPCSYRNGNDQIIDLTEQSSWTSDILPRIFPTFMKSDFFAVYSPQCESGWKRNPRLMGNSR